jgi:hypothetical protein
MEKNQFKKKKYTDINLQENHRFNEFFIASTLFSLCKLPFLKTHLNVI